MKEKGRKISPLKFSGPYRRLIALGCVLSGIASVINMVPYICIWKVTAILFENYPDFSGAGRAAAYGWAAFLVSLFGVIVYCCGLMCTHIGAFHTARRMRSMALHHLSKLPLGFFGEHASGSLRRVIDDSSGQTETFIAHRLPDFTGAVTAPIAMIAILIYFDWRLGLVSLVPLLIGFLAMSGMMGNAAGNIEKYQGALDAMNGEAVEYVRGVPVVKTFQQTVFSLKRFMKTIEDYSAFAIQFCYTFRTGKCIYDVAVNSAYAVLLPAAIVFLGACASLSDFKNLFVNIVFYVLFTPYLTVLMTKIMFTSEDIEVARIAVEKIDGLLKEEPLPEPEDGENEKSGRAGGFGAGDEAGSRRTPSSFDISFEQVSFAYSKEAGDVLKQVTLSIPQGCTAALVGPSGGGKSTLAALVPRFYDVREGSVKIGGVDVRDMKTEELMRLVSFVFQQNRLFKESLLDNIREGKPDASMEEVMRAVDMAQCGDIVAKLPDGLNTVVGTKGVYLSGGEAQRIALARAVLKDSPIVLLDEATAFADPENEYQIQRAFGELTKGKTVLMIAHRLSTVRGADRIYVVENGRIKEQGSHEELIQAGGLYSRMWEDYRQAADWRLEKEADER